MAARSRRTILDPNWRDRIKTSMLINRLQDNAFGKLEPELSASKLKSIEILLRKTVPDLAAVDLEHRGTVGLNIGIVRYSAPEQLEAPEVPVAALEGPGKREETLN